MRIFDTRWVGAHGIGRFATELFNRLGGFTGVDLDGRPSAPLDPWRLGGYLRHKAPQVFLSPGYNPPAGPVCPFIFTVHDLNHLHVNENSSALKRLYYRMVVRPAIHRARVVLTGSEFSKGQICEWSRASAAHVVNVGYGTADEFQPQGALWQAKRPYFLYVGNHRPHKNLKRVMSAFAASGLHGDLDFLITGTASEELQRHIEDLRLTAAVNFLGNVPDDQLAALYRGAVALVFVSLYEGFGLPIIEAMACGSPVLTSQAASMPEVAADAAMLVDPLSVEAIAAGMCKLAGDSALRDELRARGFRRASIFTWDATVQRVQGALAACA